MRARTIAVVVCGVCAIGVQYGRMLRSDQELNAARERYESLRANVDELRALRVTTRAVLEVPDAPEDLIACVREVMGRVGLPPERLRESAPEGERTLREDGGGADLREQAGRIVLEPLRTDELGEFLIAWQAAGSAWRITRIELQHGRQPASDPRYRVLIGVSALFRIQPSQPGVTRPPRAADPGIRSTK